MSEKTKEVPQLADATYAHTLVISLKLSSKSIPFLSIERIKFVLWSFKLCDLDDGIPTCAFVDKISYKGNCSYLCSSLPVLVRSDCSLFSLRLSYYRQTLWHEIRKCGRWTELHLKKISLPSTKARLHSEEREIIDLGASIRHFVCLSVYPSSPCWTVWPLTFDLDFCITLNFRAKDGYYQSEYWSVCL